jgi:hypothetical protein
VRVIQWFQQNGFTLLQSVGIIASLLFSAHALRADSRERKIETLFTLTAANRDLWKTFYDKPELRRILELNIGGAPEPIPTLEEQVFVRSLIFHLAASFRARKYGMYFQEAGLSEDIRHLFSLPIPRAVWKTIGKFQEHDFVEFFNAQLAPHDRNQQKNCPL